MMSVTDQITGVVVSVIFWNQENDYSVLSIDTNGSIRQTVTGYTNAKEGQTITAKGSWTETEKHGLVFVAKEIAATHPTTPESIERYLASGVIKWIGPGIARKIVEIYGEQSLDVLSQPCLLERVPGITPQKAIDIQVAWFEESQKSHAMVFLHAQNISSGFCKKIFDVYKERTEEVVRENPYRLASDIKGIGFKTADSIALHLGIPKQSPQRILAALAFHLEEICHNDGDCGILLDSLCHRVSTDIGVKKDEIKDLLIQNSGPLDDEKKLFFSEKNKENEIFIYEKSIALNELLIARKLISIKNRKPSWAKTVNLNGAIAWAESHSGMTLAEQQRAAVLMALSENVSVLTGGPGCGKTATLNVILAAMKKLGVQITLAAPTGKAAQRASEATGCDAYTIHRLLMKDKAKLACDLIVVDESSMVDVSLMAVLLSSMNPHTGLLLVGDVDQLPSVSPGQVLRDVIDSGVIATTRLTEIFRQAQDSLIIKNAHRINAGHIPMFGKRFDDFQLFTEKNNRAILNVIKLISSKEIRREDSSERISQVIASEILELVSSTLPLAHGFDPVKDVQVLSPMNKGSCGVPLLNLKLQALLNPKPISFIEINHVKYGVGDKVIQKRNNYDLHIFNGDMGYIISIDHKKNELICNFSGRDVQIPFDCLSDLSLAYAITIHKSQGSQAPAVVIPLSPQHYPMLQRNLFYTAVTRAKKLAVVIGNQGSIFNAVKNNYSSKRRTRLKFLLDSISKNNQETEKNAVSL